jgi:hypothetical protein
MTETGPLRLLLVRVPGKNLEYATRDTGIITAIEDTALPMQRPPAKDSGNGGCGSRSVNKVETDAEW